MRKRNLYVLCHQGLGDHLLCLGIYRYMSRDYAFVIVPVMSQYFESLSYLLRDLSNVHVISYSFEIQDSRLELSMESHAEWLKKFGFHILRLGSFEESFFKDQALRLDENYYFQAKLPLEYRWDFFEFERNEAKEQELYQLLVGDEEAFVFMHEDPPRGFTIDKSRVRTDLKIVKPDRNLAREFHISDYAMIIEKATEIHCIESSFAALIEGMNVSVPKYAHRYARAEARDDFRHEFTYRTGWTVMR